MEVLLIYIAAQKWGWILEERKTTTIHPYVCEIDKSEIYKVVQEDRGPGNNWDDYYTFY